MRLEDLLLMKCELNSEPDQPIRLCRSKRRNKDPHLLLKSASHMRHTFFNHLKHILNFKSQQCIPIYNGDEYVFDGTMFFF